MANKHDLFVRFNVIYKRTTASVAITINQSYVTIRYNLL